MAAGRQDPWARQSPTVATGQTRPLHVIEVEAVRPIRPAGPLVIGQLLAFGAMALLLACGFRLIWLEKHRAAELRGRAELQQTSKTGYTGCRGSIYDSNPLHPNQRIVLAASCVLDSVYVDPKLLGDEQHRGRLMVDLCAALNMSVTSRGKLIKELNEKCKDLDNPKEDEEPAGPPPIDAPPPMADSAIRPPAGTIPPGRDNAQPKAHGISRCVWVKRLIAPEESRAVRRLIKADPKNYRGIVLTADLARVYPNGPVASHVIGFLGDRGDPLGGIELQFDRKPDLEDGQDKPTGLRGIDGSKKVIATAGRQPLWCRERDFVPPRDGLSVVLNINSVIQENVQRVLEATVKHYAKDGAHLNDRDKTTGVAIVMDVRTGAVLAMASYPTFDPGDYKTSTDDQRRNRALTDPFEPGSIFKWVVVAGALERKVVTENDVFVSEGAWRDPANGRVIREAHDHAYGPLSVRMVLTKSSNIGMTKIGLKMGREKLYATVTDFGMGRKTGIELGSVESAGLLVPLRRWTSYSVPSVSFGQEIAVTPIQMLRGFCAICNGGLLVQPRLVAAVVDDSPGVLGGPWRVVEDYAKPAAPPKRIISEKTSKTMISILCDVVTKGTGQKARSDKVQIFGKTGTAQIFYHRHDTGDYTGSFIAGAPAENPRIAVIVSIRKPKKSVGYFGGTVAAPAAKQIVEDTLAFLQVPSAAPPPADPAGR